MKQDANTSPFNQHDLAILRYGTPEKVLIACLFSCLLGIIFMAVTAQYLLMSILIGVLISVIVTALLVKAGRISLTVACLIPMLTLCFVYTPVSWFTYEGLLGCTPYLSILFLSMITLTTYRKVQTTLLVLYGALLLWLIINWFRAEANGADTNQAFSILLSYGLAVAMIVTTVEAMKRKNAKINQQITDLSMHDDLTELLNRRAVEQVLSKHESTLGEVATDYAVVMIDIDSFKTINDQFGHDLGDSILKRTASAIQSSIRTQDSAFRLGGDEFLIVLPYVTPSAVEQICTRVECRIDLLGEYPFSFTISAGSAFRSECADTASLLALADQRMYQNKRKKKDLQKAVVNKA